MFWVFFILAALLSLPLLEFGKRTLWGWGLFLLLFAGFFLAHRYFFSDRAFLLRLLSWGAFLVVLAAAYHVSAPPVRPVPAVEGEAKPTRVYEVKEGKLTGVFSEDGGVEIFCGIPYAAPPTGENRWRPPQAPASWEGVRACDTYGPMSMQPTRHPLIDSAFEWFGYHTYSFRLGDEWVPPVSEDSLYLNLWRPAGEVKDLPVMVYIHGGSLTTGQPWHSEYLGEDLAREGIIVVNFAYRLGVFGYLSEDSLTAESPVKAAGNYGLLDQIAALRWVKENISAFGGDPDRITLCGESAGASSVNALCASPLTEGLFQRVIAESSGILAVRPYHTFRSESEARAEGKKLLKEFSVSNAQELRSVPAEKLVDTRCDFSAMTVDGLALTEDPRETYARGGNHETAILHGFNAHEADLFALTKKVTRENGAEILSEVYGDGAEAAFRILAPFPQEKAYSIPVAEAGGDAKGSFNVALSAAWFSYSHHLWSEALTAQKAPVYEYYFCKDNGSLGSFHAGELPYAFGNLHRHPSLYDESDRVLSRQMLRYWANFVKTGDPNGEGLPRWAPYSENGELMRLNEDPAMIPDPHGAYYPLLDAFQSRYLPDR